MNRPTGLEADLARALAAAAHRSPAPGASIGTAIRVSRQRRRRSRIAVGVTMVAALAVPAVSLTAHLTDSDRSRRAAVAGSSAESVLLDPAGDVVSYRATGGDGMTTPRTVPARREGDLRTLVTERDATTLVVRTTLSELGANGESTLQMYLGSGPGRVAGKQFEVLRYTSGGKTRMELSRIMPPQSAVGRERINCTGLRSEESLKTAEITVRVPLSCLSQSKKLTARSAAFGTSAEGGLAFHDDIGDYGTFGEE